MTLKYLTLIPLRNPRLNYYSLISGYQETASPPVEIGFGSDWQDHSEEERVEGYRNAQPQIFKRRRRTEEPRLQVSYHPEQIKSFVYEGSLRNSERGKSSNII